MRTNVTKSEFEQLLEQNNITFTGEAAYRVAQLVVLHERDRCVRACRDLHVYGSDAMQRLQIATIEDCVLAIQDETYE
jgi:hypothetical protein